MGQRLCAATGGVLLRQVYGNPWRWLQVVVMSLGSATVVVRRRRRRRPVAAVLRSLYVWCTSQVLCAFVPRDSDRGDDDDDGSILREREMLDDFFRYRPFFLP